MCRVTKFENNNNNSNIIHLLQRKRRNAENACKMLQCTLKKLKHTIPASLKKYGMVWYLNGIDDYDAHQRYISTIRPMIVVHLVKSPLIENKISPRKPLKFSERSLYQIDTHTQLSNACKRSKWNKKCLFFQLNILYDNNFDRVEGTKWTRIIIHRRGEERKWDRVARLGEWKKMM